MSVVFKQAAGRSNECALLALSTESCRSATISRLVLVAVSRPVWSRRSRGATGGEATAWRGRAGARGGGSGGRGRGARKPRRAEAATAGEVSLARDCPMDRDGPRWTEIGRGRPLRSRLVTRPRRVRGTRPTGAARGRRGGGRGGRGSQPSRRRHLRSTLVALLPALATPPPAYALEVARRSDVAFEQQQLYNPPPPVTSYQQQVSDAITIQTMKGAWRLEESLSGSGACAAPLRSSSRCPASPHTSGCA